MATILILTHEYDGFPQRTYILHGLIGIWERTGHRVVIAEGIPERAEADVVLVHLDISVLPDEYIAFAAQFPVVLNRGTRDIRKSAVSRYLLRPGDSWSGPVIVKSNLNTGGGPEAMYNLAAALRNRPAPYPTVKVNRTYPVYKSVREVPDGVWSDPHLVVERFLPEQDERGYWRRVWTFLGDRERCSRYCSPKAVFTGGASIHREPAEVPDELRAERERLGFDYGKFDFVMHHGKPVLLDANRTPASSGGLAQHSQRNFANLAAGIDGFLGKERH
jgi:hypothetical protein